MPLRKRSPSPARPPKPSLDRDAPIRTSPNEGDADGKDTPLIRPPGLGLRSSMHDVLNAPKATVSSRHLSEPPKHYIPRPSPPQPRRSWTSRRSNFGNLQPPILSSSDLADSNAWIAPAPARTPNAFAQQYQPAAPSPLRTEGSMSDMDGADDDDQVPGRTKSARAQRQRSLRIRVVPPATIDPTNMSEVAQVGVLDPTGGSPATLLRHDSPASIHSARHDFSRYPTRKPSGFLGGGQAGISDASLRTYNGERIRSPANGSPFEDQGNPFHKNDPERGFSPYVKEKYIANIVYPAPGEPEDDDPYHNPDGTEDLPLKFKDVYRYWNPRYILSVMMLFMVALGVLTLFIVVPLLNGLEMLKRQRVRPDPNLLSPLDIPHLAHLRTSLIDPDTPPYAYTRDSVLGKGELKLVFSDEFNQDGRTFYPGDDQFWEAPDYHYASTSDLEWYDPDAVITANGTLQLRFDMYKNHNLDYRSGMLHSWNKMCFKGGVMEVSASLAGPGGISGLWPGVWSLGNLARPGYRATSDGIWPYSYNQCDVGITPNQSSPDGMSYLPGQRLASCTCPGEDHPSPGRGRGAPEIDALEGTAYNNLGTVTQSVQLAPYDVWYQPNLDYVAIKNYSVTQMNSWQGGRFQQALSGVTTLNNRWYDGIEFQKYAFEYIPGGADGAVAWFVGDEETFRMTGNSIGPNGNVGQRETSHEPMSIILNLGISNGWSWIDWVNLDASLRAGTVMHVDYVRIYQEKGKELVTCDPPGYPTTRYIREHPVAYNNWNLTMWDDTGYAWPKNKFMDQCEER